MNEDEILAALTLETPAQIQALNAPDALYRAAVWYASVGWPVFPLVPGGKAPLTPRGFYDATSDVEQVHLWWTAAPQANIGTPTGKRFDVIDIDAPLGFQSFADMQDEALANGVPGPDVLAAAHTGSGGRHLLIPPTGRGNAVGVRPGVDYRGDGGYIVVPPSRLSTGGAYSWVSPPKPALVTS